MPPALRGGALARNQAAVSAGMGLGTALLAPAFAQWGYAAVGAICGVSAAFAAAVLLPAVHRRHPDQ